MKLLIDHGDLKSIMTLWEVYPLSGVTTNPSILAKTGKDPYTVLRAIRRFIGPDNELHVQVAARDAELMVEDALRIQEELGETTFVKVPAIPEGFKAMKQLCKRGIPITATAIYTPMQAYLAAECGASYAAPYINRIDNMGYDGAEVAKSIHNIFQNNKLPCKVLAASFKNSQQVLELCEYGVGACTAAPQVIEAFVKNPAITCAVEDFLSDFETLTGPGKTMANV